VALPFAACLASSCRWAYSCSQHTDRPAACSPSASVAFACLVPFPSDASLGSSCHWVRSCSQRTVRPVACSHPSASAAFACLVALPAACIHPCPFAAFACLVALPCVASPVNSFPCCHHDPCCRHCPCCFEVSASAQDLVEYLWAHAVAAVVAVRMTVPVEQQGRRREMDT